MADAIGTIKALIGSAIATSPDGSQRTLHLGDTIFADDLITTGAASAIEIEFNDGSIMDMGRNSQALLDNDVFNSQSVAQNQAELNDDIAALQQALLDGNDPSQTGDATASGAGAGDENEGNDGAGLIQIVHNQQLVTPTSGLQENDGQGDGDNNTGVLGDENQNSAPIAQAAFIGTAEDAAYEGSTLIQGAIIASDPDGDPITFELLNDAPAGLSFNPDGSYSFDPTDTAYNSLGEGEQTAPILLNIRVSDPQGAFVDTTLTLIVTGTNDQPQVSLVSDTQIEADTGLNSFNGQLTATDADATDTTHTFAQIGDITSDTTDITNLNISIDTTGNYTLTGNFNGLAVGETATVTFQYTADDGTTGINGGESSTSDAGTVSLTITGTNDAPIATNISNQQSNDSDEISVDISSQFSDIDSDILSFTATGLPDGLTIDSSTGIISGTLTSSASQTEPYTVTVTADDSNGGTTDNTFTWNVINPAPVAEDDTVELDEDTSITNSVAGNDSDPDGDELSFILNESVSNGSLTFNEDGSYSYSPTPNFNGTDSFSYTVTDADGATDTATVLITIIPVSPEIDAINDSLTVAEDSGQTTASVANNDLLGETPSGFSLVNGTANGSLAFRPDGSYDYTPDANFNGSDSFTYTITDSDGQSDTATVNITVNATSPALDAIDDSLTVDEDSGLTTASVAGNDDLGETPSSFAMTTNVNSGTLVFRPDGSYDYTPNANFNGSDSFSYSITDSDGQSDTATVTITVRSINDVPTVENTIPVQSLVEDFATYTLDLKTFFEDVETADNDLTYTISLSGNSNVNISISISSGGIATISSIANENGVKSITFIATDADGASVSQDVIFNVGAENDAPEITINTGNASNANDVVDEHVILGVLPAAGTKIAEGTFTINDLDGLNDISSIDIAGSSFVVNEADGFAGVVGQTVATAYGEITVDSYAGGTFAYTYELLRPVSNQAPIDGGVGQDSFELAVSDGFASASATLTVDINDDEPRITDDTPLLVGQSDVTVDETSLNESVELNLSLNISFYSGADGLQSVNLTNDSGQPLSVEDSGLDTIDGKSIYLYGIGLQGGQDTVLGVAFDTGFAPQVLSGAEISNPAFTIKIDDSFNLTVTQSMVIAHSDTSSPNETEILSAVHVTITDGDGDVSNAQPIVIGFSDDAPTIISEQANMEIIHDETLGVQTDNGANDVSFVPPTITFSGSPTIRGVAEVSLASLMSVNAGTDGLGSISLTQSDGSRLNHVDSGWQTNYGQTIWLSSSADGSVIWATLDHVGPGIPIHGPTQAFRLEIIDNLTVKFTQYLAIEHSDPNNANDAESIVNLIHLTVTDGDGDSVTTLNALKVTVIDDVPALTIDVNDVTAVTDTNAAGNVLINDDLGVDGGIVSHIQFGAQAAVAVPTDPNDFIIITGDYGSLLVRSNGTYSYTLSNSTALDAAPKNDVFTYSVTDGDDDMGTSTLTITVTGINNAPVIQAESDFSTIEDAGVISGQVVATDIDSDDDSSTLTYALAGTTPAAAALTGLTFNADGSYQFDSSVAVYQNLADGETANATFSWKATDSHGAESAVDSFTVTVTGTNDVPEITSGVQKVTLTEATEANEAPNLSHAAVGTITFDDLDTSDTHTVSFAAQALGYLGSFTLEPLDDIANDLVWRFNVADADIDHLTAGEQLIQVYQVAIDDGHGGVDYQDVTITIDGTNEVPELTYTVSTNTINETLDSKLLGTLNVDDVDGGAILLANYTLTGADAGLVEIVDNAGVFELRLRANVSLDFETNPNLDINIVYNDGIDDSNGIPVSVAVNNIDGAISGISVLNIFQTFNGTNDEGWVGSGAHNSVNQGMLGWFGRDTDERHQTFDLSQNSGEEIALSFVLNTYGFGGGFGWEATDTFIMEIKGSNGDVILNVAENNIANNAFFSSGHFAGGRNNFSYNLRVPLDGQVTVQFYSQDTRNHGSNNGEYWNVDNFAISSVDAQVLTFDAGSSGEINLHEFVVQSNDFTGDALTAPGDLTKIDISSGSHVLSNIAVDDVVNLTDVNNTLAITTNSGTIVQLDDSVWEAGINTNEYTNLASGATAAGSVTLVIDASNVLLDVADNSYDILSGTDGDDDLFATVSSNVMNGGDSADNFVWTKATVNSTTPDEVMDFNSAEDTLDLSDLLSDLSHEIVGLESSGHLQVQVNTASGELVQTIDLTNVMVASDAAAGTLLTSLLVSGTIDDGIV